MFFFESERQRAEASASLSCEILNNIHLPSDYDVTKTSCNYM